MVIEGISILPSFTSFKHWTGELSERNRGENGYNSVNYQKLTSTILKGYIGTITKTSKSLGFISH